MIHRAGRAFARARARARKRSRDLGNGAETLWLRLASLPLLQSQEVGLDRPNTLFSRRGVRELRGHVQRMAYRDRDLAARLAERRIEGLRGWEYGVLLATLLGYADRGGWRALDVGTGNSTFPRYLLATRNVGTMTTFDLPSSYEEVQEQTISADHGLGIERVHGSMLDMPFEDGCFDLVTCISAIEHLDGDPTAHKRGLAPAKLPYGRYVADTSQALREMARVVKPGGFLYLTTDAYMPELQASDTWSSPDGTRTIWSAYRFSDIERTFVETLEKAGLELVGGSDYAPELLLNDPDRSSYRGRYFTTFAVFARRLR